MLKLTSVILSSMLFLADFESTEFDAYTNVMKTNTSAHAVTLDDIYELNLKYSENDGSNGERVFEKNSVCIINKDNYMQLLVAPSGYSDYECRFFEEGSSEVLPIFLKHIFTEEKILLTASREEVDQYIEETTEISNDIRNKVLYIHNTFNENQYGGAFYNRETGNVCVYVTDENIRKKLDEMGVECVKGEYSLDTLYGALREVWEYRKEWGINYIEVNPCINRIVIYASDREGILQRLEKAGISCAEVKQGVVLHPGDLDRTLDLGNLKTDDPEVVYYILKTERDSSDLELKEGLRILKEKYPGYECRNLLIRIAADGDYERYLDFDEELVEFADSLPAYVPNEKDPVEELLFGDPERIELKSQLREYKSIYTEMSYKEIYEKYLSDWEDTSVYSREKKLYDLAICRQKGELKNADFKIIQNDENVMGNKKQTGNTAVFGSVLLVIGAVGIISKKKYDQKKHSR